MLDVNFDPSHLVRMGIDPHRFLREFGPRVRHVHLKDVEFLELDDELYEHGNLQPATFVAPHRYGGHHWRYTIPGHGVIRWATLMRELAGTGYAGRISIELEDEHYNGSEEAEQRALIGTREFLRAI